MAIVRRAELNGRLTVHGVNGSGECCWDEARLEDENLAYLLDELGLIDRRQHSYDDEDYGYVRLTIEQYGPAPEQHGPPRVVACPRCGSLTPTAPDYRCFDCGRAWEVTP